MNPWGAILVAVGILLIMIGITGSQHKLLTVFKGVPTAASGGPATRKAAQNTSSTPATTSDNSGAAVAT